MPTACPLRVSTSDSGHASPNQKRVECTATYGQVAANRRQRARVVTDSCIDALVEADLSVMLRAFLAFVCLVLVRSFAVSREDGEYFESCAQQVGYGSAHFVGWIACRCTRLCAACLQRRFLPPRGYVYVEAPFCQGIFCRAHTLIDPATMQLYLHRRACCSRVRVCRRVR